MMRLMNLRTRIRSNGDDSRRLAVSPAHVRYVERAIDHVKVYITDEAIPLLVTDTFDQVVKEWQDALEGRMVADNSHYFDDEEITESRRNGGRNTPIPTGDEDDDEDYEPRDDR